MGYTHYYNIDNCGKQDEIGYEKSLPIIRKVLKKYNNRIQKECDDDKKPVCTKKNVRFNGIGDDGHEIFYFNIKDAGHFTFCKTARKPYDIVVCEVLLILNAYCPHMTISSDGFSGYLENKKIDGEWENAVKNVKEYGINYHIEVVEEREPYCNFEPILDSME